MLRIPAHSIGTKAYSIHLSFLYFAMGSPYGSSVVFLPLDLNEIFIWITGRYSFRMGSPFSGQILTIRSRLKELLQLGSWQCFFRTVLGMFGHPVGSEVWGCLHIQRSSLLVRTLSVSHSPTKEWVLAFLLLALLPLALPP